MPDAPWPSWGSAIPGGGVYRSAFSFQCSLLRLAAGRDNGSRVQPRTILPWVADHKLETYPSVKPSAAEAIVETILRSPQPITVIAIGPLTNIGDALALEPRIAQKARFVGMHGSVRVAYDGKPGNSAEWNVVCDVEAARRTFAAPWPKLITPLDTCGDIRLDAAFCRRLAATRDPLCRTVWESWQHWRAFYANATNPAGLPPPDQTSILFDTVAVFLAFSRQWLTTETVRLTVTDDGFTREDPAGHSIEAALTWTDKPAFIKFLEQRLAP